VSPLALSHQFLQSQPDGRLIALAREGHEAAFEALVRRYRKELLAYCRRLQPRSGGAEDALQQTLLQAWRALKDGAEVREARPWLYRIAHNVTLNHLRVAVAEPRQAPEAADGQEVDQLVEQRLQARAALAGMASLPALQRDVFVSTTLNGASHEEVASALGLSSGAVRGLIYRARATLRSAAAALTPSPALHWAISRAESGTGRVPAISEALAGGGGAGVAAALAKGGAVLSIAGAVAGAGGVIIDHGSSHHGRPEAPLATRPTRSAARSRVAEARPEAAELAQEPALPSPSRGSLGEDHPGQAGRRLAVVGGRNSGSVRERHRGSGGARGERSDRSQGESGGSSSTGSSGRPLVEATISSDGSSGSSSGASSRGSDGGSGGPTSNSTSTTSGSDGGTSGAGTLTTAQMTPDGGSGPEGGTTSSPTSSPGSGETTTTASPP
jgi:RNA polymerase sigma factor (sigma-70 family)